MSHDLVFTKLRQLKWSIIILFAVYNLKYFVWISYVSYTTISYVCDVMSCLILCEPLWISCVWHNVLSPIVLEIHTLFLKMTAYIYCFELEIYTFLPNHQRYDRSIKCNYFIFEMAQWEVRLIWDVKYHIAPDILFLLCKNGNNWLTNTNVINS